MTEDFAIENWRCILDGLRGRITSGLSGEDECYLDLAGRKTVRVVIGDPAAWKLIRRELGWVITSRTDNPDATIYLWKEPDVREFAQNMVGCGKIIGEEEEYVVFKVHRDIDESKAISERYPSGQVNMEGGTVYLASGNEYYYGTASYEFQDIERRPFGETCPRGMHRSGWERPAAVRPGTEGKVHARRHRHAQGL